MNHLVLPIIIPLITAAISVIAWGSSKFQKGISFVGTTLYFASTLYLLWFVSIHGIISIQIGDWPAPFGITFVADLFSSLMLAVTGLIGWTVLIYSLASIRRERAAFGYYPVYQILLMGVSGSFLTGDIFNLYVWFEVMLISSFVLMSLGGERFQMEGAVKYVTLNLISSALFLAGIGILYGVVGSLNMADLAVKLRTLGNPSLMVVLSMLFFVAFGIKAAVFPLFFWLPASYHTPPVSVSAIFAGLLTKVGVYALIRVFTLLFVQDISYTHTIILLVAGLTMITGVFGAMVQVEFRRILSFHIISQIGYMIMGLGLLTPLALAGSVFYIIHHIIVKTNLFLVSGVTYRFMGSFELKKLGGFYKSKPFLAILFLIPALSLAGVPPLSGFFSKLILIQAGLQAKEYLIVAVALGVSLLTLYSMTKIWAEVFWKSEPKGERAPTKRWNLAGLLVPISILAVLTISIGLMAEPLFTLSFQAAEQLLNPTEYIRVVLGKTL